MKKFKSFILLSTLALGLTGCSSAPASTNSVASETVEAAQATYVDTYTSASATKTTLSDADLTAAAEALTLVSSDLATLADSQVEGYKEPETVANAQVLSVNPDGSVGVSTITGWKYEKGSDSNDTIRLELTEGQNALNLNQIDARGSLIVKTDVNHIVHFKITNIDVLEYTDENFENGLFNSHYTGQKNKASQYAFTCEVLAIEKSPLVMFD